MKNQTPFAAKPSAPADAETSRPRQKLLRRLVDAVKTAFSETEANVSGAAGRAASDDGVFQPRKY